MTTFRRTVFSFSAALLTSVLLLAGCGSFGGDEYFPPATEILRVEVEPNPVAAGDTAVFTCVIEDSLESGFTFTWVLKNHNGYVTNVVTTDTNQYRWEAPSDTSRYAHEVDVYAPDNPNPVEENFDVTVTENNSSDPSITP